MLVMAWRPIGLPSLLLFLYAVKVTALLPRKGRFNRLGTFVQADAPADRPSSVNCTWKTFEQPIDHFGKAPGTFLQRYCIYAGFWGSASAGGFQTKSGTMGPILFYTGNESPVEVYVNNTGLMWELGPKLKALLVFAEHRYEPMSHPSLCGSGTQLCMAYCTTAQALADYAALVDALQPKENGPVPVVALGGSYGGMLAGWMRMKYPDVIAGAIAASAPVWMLPTTVERETLDMPAVAISRGVTAVGGSSDQCFSNLQAAWPLLEQVAMSKDGLTLLSSAVKSCQPLQSADEVISWAQATYFLMAEANYPYPSTYITYAVGPGNYPLPPWPMRAACKFLEKDFGVKVTGDTREVNYSIALGEIEVTVDWASATGNGAKLTAAQIKGSGILSLAAALADASGIWYNVSKDKTCYDMASAPHDEVEPGLHHSVQGNAAAETFLEALPAGGADSSCPACPPCEGCPACPLSRCNASDSTPCSFSGVIPLTFSWTGITCNDDLNELSATGLGRDFYWPPSVPLRNYTVESIVGSHDLRPGCNAGFVSEGLHGFPMTSDPYSSWLTAYYGGRNITAHTNIVWSNGALDPWSGQGVYPPGGGPGGAMIQSVNKDASQIALILDLGAHHLDLMFSDNRDPPCASEARKVEEARIRQWCHEAYVVQLDSSIQYV